MKMEIKQLHLAAPIYYLREQNTVLEDPNTALQAENLPEERIYCYELEPSQALEFEPCRDSFLKNPVFCGKTPEQNQKLGSIENDTEELPEGTYLLYQEEGYLKSDRIKEIAYEIQQEGLWRRLLPCPRHYIRFIREDNRIVTQLLRPYLLKS